MDPDLRRALNASFRERYGCISVRDAKQLGVSADQLQRMVRAGDLQRTRRRTYAPLSQPDTWRARMAQDLTAVLRPAWASHTAALHLHGLHLPWLTVHRELTVIGSTRPDVDSDVEVHRTTGFAEEDLTERYGIPCTTPERAIIDLSERLTPEHRILLVDEAIMSEVVDRQLLNQRAAALATGRKGVGEIADVTAPGAAKRFRSRLEKAGLPLLVAAGLTPLEVNVVPQQAPAAGECDVVSEAHRLVVDWDGLRFHARPGARQRDDDKANQLAIGRYANLRFTWRDVFHRGRYVTLTTARVLGG